MLADLGSAVGGELLVDSPPARRKRSRVTVAGGVRPRW